MAAATEEGNGDEMHVPPTSHRPRHAAIIMDGNGRWARARGLPRLEGHRRGADIVREITTFARELEIPFLTLYSFSVQNWRRPPAEVAGLMQLLEDYCEGELSTLMENGIRLNSVGRTDRLPASTRAALEDTKRETAANEKMTLTLAIDYGGREELVAAAQKIARDVAAGSLEVGDVDAKALESRLMTSELPAPDLVVRTSGEQRVSNFLLWQIAYSELYYTSVAWPDFTKEHFVAALEDFATRDRRFGATQEQIVDAVGESDYVRGRAAAGQTQGSGEAG